MALISFLVSSASVEEVSPPIPEGPIVEEALVYPGVIVMDVKSISERRLSMSADKPSLREIMLTTAPTPITIPIMVSQLLILLCNKMLKAILR
jgi:hypothetical protein